METSNKGRDTGRSGRGEWRLLIKGETQAGLVGGVETSNKGRDTGRSGRGEWRLLIKGETQAGLVGGSGDF